MGIIITEHYGYKKENEQQTQGEIGNNSEKEYYTFKRLYS